MSVHPQLVEILLNNLLSAKVDRIHPIHSVHVHRLEQDAGYFGPPYQNNNLVYEYVNGLLRDSSRSYHAWYVKSNKHLVFMEYGEVLLPSFQPKDMVVFRASKTKNVTFTNIGFESTLNPGVQVKPFINKRSSHGMITAAGIHTPLAWVSEFYFFTPMPWVTVLTGAHSFCLREFALHYLSMERIHGGTTE